MFKSIFEKIFFQLLEGQSETLKDQNGVEFNFQSTYTHHKTLIWRSWPTVRRYGGFGAVEDYIWLMMGE